MTAIIRKCSDSLCFHLADGNVSDLGGGMLVTCVRGKKGLSPRPTYIEDLPRFV